MTPELAQVTVVQFLSDDAAENITFNPRIVQGGAFYAIGTPSQVAWGSTTLGTVTAKNRTSGTPLLQANLGQACASVVGDMIWNTTHAARAWIDSCAGNVATLQQPMVANTPAAPTRYASFPAEVDTWTTGDSFTIMRPTSVNLVEYLPTQPAGDTSLTTGTLSFLGGVSIPDPSGVGLSQFITNTSVFISESQVLDFTVYVGSNIQPGSFLGTAANTDFAGGGALNGAWISGGGIGRISGPRSYPVNFLESNGLDGDLVLHGLTAVQANGSQNNAESLLSLVYADNEIDVYSTLNVSQNEYHARGVYGTYTLNVKRGGVMTYTTPASGGSGAFVGTPTLKFTDATTGWSVTSAQPAVWNGGITLDPTHLDNAAGSNGFGGHAWDLLNGAVIGTGTD